MFLLHSRRQADLTSSTYYECVCGCAQLRLMGCGTKKLCTPTEWLARSTAIYRLVLRCPSMAAPEQRFPICRIAAFRQVLRSGSQDSRAFLRGFVFFFAILEGGSLANITAWYLTQEWYPSLLVAAALIVVQGLSLPRRTQLPVANA